MSKNIYDMLNDSEINLDEYKKEEFNHIEKAKIKKVFRNSVKKKKNYKKGTIAAAVVVGITVGLFGTNTGNQVLASINIISTDIASRLGVTNNLEEYKTVVDKSVTKNGMTIQLDEVVLDGDKLIVSTTIKNNEGKIEGYLNSSESIYINGKLINGGSGGGSKRIDDNTIESTISYDLGENNTNGDIEVKIKYRDLWTENEKIKGPWVFEFKTNGDELMADTEKIQIDNKFVLENGDEVTIENYTSNSLGQKIYYSKTGNENKYDIKLEGTDNLGNKVEVWSKNSSNKCGLLTRYDLDGPLSSEAKSITLTPYAVKYPEQSGKMSDDFKKVGEAFIIELKN